jgi:hypothetical protein
MVSYFYLRKTQVLPCTENFCIIETQGVLKFYFATIFQSTQHYYEKREGTGAGS